MPRGRNAALHCGRICICIRPHAVGRLLHVHRISGIHAQPVHAPACGLRRREGPSHHCHGLQRLHCRRPAHQSPAGQPRAGHHPQRNQCGQRLRAPWRQPAGRRHLRDALSLHQLLPVVGGVRYPLHLLLLRLQQRPATTGFGTRRRHRHSAASAATTATSVITSCDGSACRHTGHSARSVSSHV